ncbi:MAG: hypothetical protein JWO12_1859 [Frankiales bacterium]|nr:hypothetical protein [Frankiales bacterium]
MTARRLASCLLALLALTGCGGGSKHPSTATPVVKVDDTAAITTAWESFFNASGTVDSHVALLEDGSVFKAELTTVAASAESKGLSAKVDKVVVTGDRATVTYDLLNSGTALLTAAEGLAVRDNGTWKVSKATYCQLAKLRSPGKHTGCS